MAQEGIDQWRALHRRIGAMEDLHRISPPHDPLRPYCRRQYFSGFLPPTPQTQHYPIGQQLRAIIAKMSRRRSSISLKKIPCINSSSHSRSPTNVLMDHSSPIEDLDWLSPTDKQKKDIQSRLTVVSTQSINSLVEELEKDQLRPVKTVPSTQPLALFRGSQAKTRPENEWEKAAFHAYRERLTSKITQNHEHLEKLIWDMQDTLDELVSESLKQVDCLDEIEDLFGMVKKAAANPKPVEPPAVIEIVLPSPAPTPAPAPTAVATAEKSTQCSEFVEDVFSLALLEERHCQYMLEVFGHLRFCVEVVTPYEVERPRKSKPLPLSNSEFYAEHRLRLKGTIHELNMMLVDVSMQQKVKMGHLIVPRARGTKQNSPQHMSPLLSPVSLPASPSQPPTHFKFLKNITLGKQRGPTFGHSLLDNIVMSFNLRLLTIDPYKLQQTRPLPQMFQSSTKLKYAEIEHIQTLMPEVADIHFNIKDLFRMEMTADQLYANSYFTPKKDDISEATWAKVEDDVANALQLYRFLCKRKRYFRLIFVSYNMEAMSAVNDMLSMEFPTFVKLLKDCMLLTSGFDLIFAAKVFYLSCTSSKELPETPDTEEERKWFKHLLNSYNFKSNYRMKLSGFIESLLRITHYHPRFQKMSNLRLYEKLALLYKRSLKPNARLTQGNFYRTLLRDLHITDVLVQYESLLYEIYQGYISKLTFNEQLVDFVGKNKKMDLHRFYSFLSNAGVLMEAEIVSVGNDDIEEEIDKLNEMHHARSDKGNRSPLRPNQPMFAKVKETTIRFPSSMFERVENKHIKVRASRNTRQAGSSRDMVLLPFYRPMRGMLQLDKLTAFSFFVSVMGSIDNIYLLNPKNLDDTDFCIDFKEFVDVMGMLGILYWKTVAKCLDMSLIDGLVTFLRSIVEKFRYMREFRGVAAAELERQSMALLRLRTAPIPQVQTKPLITKTMIPQERFLTRRDSV